MVYNWLQLQMKKLILTFAVVLFAGVASAQDVFEYNGGDATEESISSSESSIIDASFITEQTSIPFVALTDEERVEKIDLFLTQNRKYLPKGKMPIIRETLMGLSETQLKNVLMAGDSEFKDPTVALVLSLFLGGLGVDRFYIGDTGLGVAKLLTVGGLGVWTVVDWFVIMKRTRNNNYKELMDLCGQLSY